APIAAGDHEPAPREHRRRADAGAERALPALLPVARIYSVHAAVEAGGVDHVIAHEWCRPEPVAGLERPLHLAGVGAERVQLVVERADVDGVAVDDGLRADAGAGAGEAPLPRAAGLLERVDGAIERSHVDRVRGHRRRRPDLAVGAEAPALLACAGVPGEDVAPLRAEVQRRAIDGDTADEAGAGVAPPAHVAVPRIERKDDATEGANVGGLAVGRDADIAVDGLEVLEGVVFLAQGVVDNRLQLS